VRLVDSPPPRGYQVSERIVFVQPAKLPLNIPRDARIVCAGERQRLGFGLTLG